MKLFFSYLKSRIRVLILYVVIACVFAASYLLFDMPSIAVLYPLSMSLAIGIIVVIIDFILFRCRHEKLISEELPSPRDKIEEDYQQIIDKLKEEADLSKMKASEDYNNMVEYYTVWAHQIKTPIAAMRLNLQSEDTESARRLMGDLARIEAYVEMVLTFIRLDSDSTDYLIKEYDLDEIIRPAIRKYSKEFILKKLKLEYEIVDYKVLTDSKWLSFIIEQVISNSVKYTSEGYVKIYMSSPGVLCIEDSGIGIREEDLPRIFENGYTGFNGREDKRASGIGLYLCKRIADNLGHKISAESKQGEGTKIFLDMKRKEIGIE
ncbi:MAG: sensor histidine kinase [Clostridiales bacterium]|nr:sensor histidine kinase [Clostridiales bacterium]